MKLSTTKNMRPCTTTNTSNSNPTTHTSNITTKQHKKTFLLGMKRTHQSSQHTKQSHQMHANLRKNWRDYQGFKNWEGLLDPLDENLRNEIIRYGHFVEAAYRACNFDPSSPSIPYANCKYSKNKLLHKSGFARTGYRVTKNLNATSGIQFPSWTAERAPSWMTVQSSWIGYVAVCQDKEEISRLGRRDVVIALRGTATSLEWLENMRATLTPVYDGPGPDRDRDSRPMVESGFLSLYTSRTKERPSMQALVMDEISRILEKYEHEPLSLTITGHSLGAALATLVAYDVKKTFRNKAPLVTVISFGGPRVGNRSFGRELERQGTKVLRIVNNDDVVTKVPGFVRDYENEGRCYGINSYYMTISEWAHRVVEDMQWVYADVGCELRLSSRDSPSLSGINVVGCHELKTYLHLVNGFVGSNCPFRLRAAARKMMRNKY